MDPQAQHDAWIPRRIAARLRTVTTWVAWLVMLAGAFTYVCRYSTEMPAWDDLNETHALRPEYRASWAWYWWPCNEHRIPLARLVHHLSIEWTRDVRAGAILGVALLGILAAGLMRAAARLRGRTSLSDAFFPLILLEIGNSDNLLNAFQLVFTIPTFLIGMALARLSAAGERLDRRTVLGVGLVLVLLPLCSLAGLLWSVPLFLWIAWQVVRALRGRIAAERAAVPIAVVCLLATAAVDVRCTFGWTRPVVVAREATVGEILRTAWEYCGQVAGWAAAAWDPWSGTIAFVAFAFGVLFLWQARGRGLPSLVLTGVGACFAAHATAALALGWGRGMDGVGAAYVNRYTELSAIGLCTVYIATLVAGPTRVGRWSRAVLCMGALCIALANVQPAIDYGRVRQANVDALEADLARGWSLARVARKHVGNFYFNAAWFATCLDDLHAARIGPFAAGRLSVSPEQLSAPALEPIESASPSPIIERNVKSQPVRVVCPEGRLVFALPRNAMHVHGSFGMHPRAWVSRKSRGARFVVSLVRPDDSSVVLLDREILRERAGDTPGPHEFEFEFDAGEFDRVVLRTSKASGGDSEMDWAYFGALAAD